MLNYLLCQSDIPQIKSFVGMLENRIINMIIIQIKLSVHNLGYADAYRTLHPYQRYDKIIF